MINNLKVSPIELTKITGQSLKILMEYERGDKVKNARSVMSKINSRKMKIGKRI